MSPNPPQSHTKHYPNNYRRHVKPTCSFFRKVGTATARISSQSERHALLFAKQGLGWALRDLDRLEECTGCAVQPRRRAGSHGQVAEAEGRLREAKRAVDSAFGESDRLTLKITDTLAVVLYMKGDNEAAIAVFEQAAAAARESAGEEGCSPKCRRSTSVGVCGSSAALRRRSLCC